MHDTAKMANNPRKIWIDFIFIGDIMYEEKMIRLKLILLVGLFVLYTQWTTLGADARRKGIQLGH